MRIISVINLKGGVGKTTTSANMAYALARYHECKVLIIDNDKQGNISRLFKCYEEDESCGMAKVMCKEAGREVIKHTEYDRIDIITANMTLLSANLEVMKDEGEQHTRLRNYLNLIDDPMDEYDYVIIDNPPTIDMCVINAMACTDDVIVPVKVDKWSLEGLDIITEQVANGLDATGRALLYWERDERTPDIFNFYHLSKLYGVTIEQLMGLEQPELEMKEKRMFG